MSVSFAPTVPAIGDQFVGICCVWTVEAITPIEGIDGPTVKVVLTHPGAGELHLPVEDFDRLVARGSLEPFTA